MTEFIVKDTSRGNERECDSRSEAEETRDDMVSLGADPSDLVIESVGADGGTTETEVVEETTQLETAEHDNRPAEPPTTDTTTEADGPNQNDDLPSDIPVDKDPLDVLPGYMIDHVQGQPALNKRGLSVLAYNYGVTVVDREIIVSPHESEWEYAIVETTVENEDGNRFVGTGTAHVDRGDDKEILLEMAETRSYKRSVSFATGTGIVSYQELTNQLE